MTVIDLSQIKQAKFIKLGRQGKWERLCFDDGTLRLGYDDVPANFNPETDKKVIFDLFNTEGKPKQVATNHVNQVMDFYTAGPETLWVTFAEGRLWWAQAHKKVEFLGHDREQNPNGSRLKRTISGWHNCSIGKKPLHIGELSGKLTRTANFQQTICDIKGEAFDYLLHKLKDEDLSEIKEAKIAKEKMLKAIEDLIRLLTWKDFELFVELLFTSSGWRRISPLGGSQKTMDIELMSPLTNEKAYVQVKSETSQQELEHYIEEFSSMPANRFFYAHHSNKAELQTDHKEVTIMGPDKLAESALRSGLVDWLMGKVG